MPKLYPINREERDGKSQSEPTQATAYDAVAEWYDERIRNDDLVHGLTLPAVLDLIGAGTLRGIEVCDLACGQGLITHILADYGAHITGVDISQELLARAREAEAARPHGITYLHDDISVGATLPDAAFDGTLCHMALMDVADLGGVAQTVERILRPGGWFVFVVTHPCYQTPNSTWQEPADGGIVKRLVAGYFDIGFWRPATQGSATSVRERVGAYHRTLSMYLNAFAAVGLAFTRMQEPQITPKIAERLLANNPTEMRRLLASGGREIPIVLAARFEKR